MSRFYFRKVQGHSWIDDLEGTELPGLAAARKEAEARALPFAATDHAEQTRIQVLDEGMNVLFVVRVAKVS